MGRNKPLESIFLHLWFMSTQNHGFLLMLQGSLTVDTHDVLTSTGVTEEAQILAVDTPFRVLVSEGLPKVRTSSRVHEV